MAILVKGHRVQNHCVNRLTAALALLCMALLLGIWFIWNSVQIPVLKSTDGNYTISTPNLDDDNLNIASNIEIDAYDGITDRPLFSDTRSPDQVIDESEAESNTEDSDIELEIKLVGVARVNEQQVAMVMDTSAKKLYRLKIGDEIHAWKVDGIESNSLSLSKGDKEKTVALSRIEVKNNTANKKQKNSKPLHIKANSEVQI